MKLRPFAYSIALLALTLFFVQGCSVLRQAEEARAFSRCRFRLASVSSLRLAGIDMQNVASRSQLSLPDAGRLGLALANHSLPLTFRLNLEVQNPNPNTAAMNKMSWTLFIDQIEMLSGMLNERVEIAPNGSSLVPLDISVDLFKALSGQSAETIANFAFNLAGEGGKPTRMMLRIKPTLNILGSTFSYPIDVGVELSASGVMPTNSF
ncbi:MAG: LEA type 2 family protein [Candidatus Thermochlorobacter sp.]